MKQIAFLPVFWLIHLFHFIFIKKTMEKLTGAENPDKNTENQPQDQTVAPGAIEAPVATTEDKEAAVADARGVGQTELDAQLTEQPGETQNPNTITDPVYTIAEDKIANHPAVPETNEDALIESAPSPELYKIEAADLNAYPELSQQGLQYGQQIAYGSAWVNKWATGEKLTTVQVPWPVSVTPVKNGITFKEQ